MTATHDGSSGSSFDGAQAEAQRRAFAACVDEMVRRLDSGYSVIASRHEPSFAPSPGSLASILGPNAVDHMPRIRELRREMGIAVEVDRVFLIELANAARQRAPSSDRTMSTDARKIAGDDDVDPLVALLMRPGARQRLARLADDLLPIEERKDPLPDPLETSRWLATPDLRIEPRQEIERGAPEPWLLIDEAAKLAGESPDRVRKAATKRKRNPLPILGDDGKPLILTDLENSRDRKPARPCRVRVSDVRSWAARSRAAEEHAATKAAIPGHGATQHSQPGRRSVEGGHGNPK